MSTRQTVRTILYGNVAACESRHFRLSVAKLRASAGAVVLAASLAVVPHAWAQQAPPTGTEAADNTEKKDTPALGEVVVTGSRIQATGMNAATPTTVVGAETLQEISPGNIAQAVTQLPEFFNNTGPANIGPVGTALGATTVNLRGLGTQRTLTLLNGRRIVPFNLIGSVDISMLPSELTQRVDLVTGGASAAYGTDAVAGVVNFITNNRFEGLSVRGQGGISDLGDNANEGVSIAFGHEILPKLHFVGSVDYFHNNQIASFAGRSYFQSWGTVTDPTNPLRLLVEPDVVATAYTCGGLITGVPTNSALYRQEFLPNGTTAPFRNSTLGTIGTGQQSQSIAPQFGGGSGCDVKAQAGRADSESVQPEQGRVSTFGNFTYDLNDNVQLGTQVFFGYTNLQSVGNSAIMQGTFGATIYSGNPYLPANVQQIMNQEGLASFGFSRYGTDADVARGQLIQTNQTISVTPSIDAVLPDNWFMGGWKVDGYFQYGRNTNEQTIHDFVRIDHIYQALDAVRDPATGNIVCNAALLDPSQYGNCVPINLFGIGNASQAALNYIEGPDRTTESFVTEEDFELSANGKVTKGWAGDINGAFGIDYRDTSLDQHLLPSDILDTTVPANNPALGIRGIPSGSVGTQLYQFSTIFPTSGSYDVKEAFGELNIPLLDGVPGIQHMDLDAAVRWADYEGSGGIWAYKAALSWNVVEAVRLRATYSRDVRAATLQERFNNQGAGGGIVDPLLNNLAYTPTIFTGGNPNVNPEKADTITAGIVYQPQWAQGLQASLDVYHIKVMDAIGQLSAQQIVTECAANAASPACSDLVRVTNPDGTPGEIRFIYANYINLSSLMDSGADAELDYTRRGQIFGGGPEAINVRFLGTYLQHRTSTAPGAFPDDAAGDDGAGYPHFGFQAMGTYTNGPWKVFLREQGIGSGLLGRQYVLGNSQDVNNTTISENHVPSVFYTDLHFTNTPWSSQDLEIYLNIDNLFNKAPPLIPSFSLMGGTNPTNLNLYDLIGRRYTLGFHYKM